MSWIYEATDPLTVCPNERCDQCDDCQIITLMGHKQLRRNDILVLAGSARRFCSNIPQSSLRPPDTRTVIHDTNHMSCAGSPSMLTSYPMFILNISINTTGRTVSKLGWFMCRPPYHAKWFMCRPPYHAKYQGEKRRKRIFIPSNLHLHFSQCFYNVKTGGLNRGGILPTLCGTRTRLLVHSLAGTKY